jgi:hypothetical protein
MKPFHVVIESNSSSTDEHLLMRKEVQTMLRRIRGDDGLIVTRLSYETESPKKAVASPKKAVA